MPFQFGDLDPSSAEFFLQEERLAQMRSEYERQCRVSGVRAGDVAPLCLCSPRTPSLQTAAQSRNIMLLGFFSCNGFFTLIQVLGGWKALATGATGRAKRVRCHKVGLGEGLWSLLRSPAVHQAQLLTQLCTGRFLIHEINFALI